jgi:hypothetical protein
MGGTALCPKSLDRVNEGAQALSPCLSIDDHRDEPGHQELSEGMNDDGDGGEPLRRSSASIDNDFHMRTRFGALSVQEILSHDEHQGRSQWKSEGGSLLRRSVQVRMLGSFHAKLPGFSSPLAREATLAITGRPDHLLIPLGKSLPSDAAQFELIRKSVASKRQCPNLGDGSG